MGEIAQLKGALPEVVRPRDYNGSQLQLIRRTVAADTSADEFSLFIEVAKRTGLDPFKRQVYAVVYNKDKADKRKMSIITGIDGFRAVAARNRDYRPSDDETEIFYDETLKDPATNPLGIERAVYRAYKLAPDGQWHKVVGTAYWAEFAPIKETWGENDQGKWKPTGKFELPATSNWRSMARVMIGKCAEAQSLRRGWPEDLSGVYTPEEMARAEAEVTASEQVDKYQEAERMKLVGATSGVAVWWRAGEPLEMVQFGGLVDRCLEFLRGCESATEVMNWFNTNRVSFQTFWAHSKSDALVLKQEIESRHTELGGEQL